MLAILIASGLGGPGAPEPFPQVPSAEVVVGADGAIVYEWPAVPTLSLLTTPLDEIDAWMERASWRAAKVYKWARHDLAGECPERNRWCMCANGRMGPYPVDRMLSPELWRMLVERVGRDAARTGDLTHVRSLLDRLVMFRGSLEPAQTPDLTPVLLAVIDIAARGDRTFLLHASKVHAWSDANPGILNRELVRARLDEAMQRVTTQEQALAVAVLASSLGLGDDDQEMLMFQRIRANVSRATAVGASQPSGPWEPGQGGRLVIDVEGRKAYVWPAVPDAYLETAPLGEIDEWIKAARLEEAVASGRVTLYGPGDPRRLERHMTHCGPITGERDVAPLTPAQWNALAHRAARSLGDRDEAAGAVRVAGLMELFPVGTDWPMDGFRALADALLGHAIEVETEQVDSVVSLAARFTYRTGHTGFLRRVADLLRRTPDTGARARLAEVALACESAEHDLSPAEQAIFGAELLATAERASEGQRFKLTSAALSVSGTASMNLWDRAMTSGHPDIRRAALSWAYGRVRGARWLGDARTEQLLRARTDRMIAAIDDPDEQVAATALTAVIIMLENEPDALAAELIRGLGTRAILVDTYACSELSNRPWLAVTVLGTLLQLSDSPDEGLRSAAAIAVWAVENAERKQAEVRAP
jgi:hypothetical protein